MGRGERSVEVLMMIGPYVGEIRDIRPSIAREMIADGRGIDPNAPIQESVPELLATLLPAPEQPARTVRKPVLRLGGDGGG